MSINNNNNNAQNSNNIHKNEKLQELILNTLEDIEHRTKTLKIKDIKIKENIRSIKLKEKKYSKITEEITSRKEELKLIKQLLNFKEQKSMNPEDIISSYLDFIITSNNLLNDKLDSLMEKEININMKQKFINKLLNKEINDDNYDLSLSGSINKPTDISKFILKPKKKKEIDNGGDNLDNFFMNRINNNNLFSIKRNNISLNSSFEKISNGQKKINLNNVNRFINKDITKFQKYANNSERISRLISNNNSNNISLKEYNVININEKEENSKNVYSITNKNDFPNYNLKPNKKLKRARDTFKKLLNQMNKSDEIIFSTNKTDELKEFFLNVLNAQYFLRKILYMCYEAAEIYNINKQNSVETIHDNEFISKLIEDYEDIGEKNDLKELNNFKIYEEGLEQIKKITSETKQLEDAITQFAHKINVYE